MRRRMLSIAVWMLVCGVGVSHAAPLTVTRTLNLGGIFFIGQDVYASIDFANNRPAGDTTLDVLFRGDYDNTDEFASISLEGTPVGEAGTTMDGSFLGTHVTNHGPDDISFTRSFVISQGDMLDAIKHNGIASLLFHHGSHFNVGENTRISVTYVDSRARTHHPGAHVARAGLRRFLLATATALRLYKRGRSRVKNSPMP